MMERQNGNMSPCKTTEREIKGKPPYSVETPYGFRIDLDFLKYVDDIEKGNTIKRVPIQRRSKGPRASTLPRHLNPAGCGYRPSPWGSTGALGPKSRLSNDQHCGFTSWAYDHRSPVSPTGLKSLAEMEARIKEFDEQPLGEHIRPHLLRASSLPLTVLLRQGSESTDEPTSLRSSRDHLGTRNTSCEDVFHLLDSPRSQDCSGLLRRLTEALERVGELEMEVRVIPELRAQICILQEERQRLHLSVNPHNQPPSMNGTTHTVDIKRPRHESRVMFPGSHNVSQSNCNPTHEWRTSSDLDELLTVTSLQAKVAMLEQKLHETGLELQRVSGLLREQQRESSRNDKKIDNLTRNPGVWVCAERVVVDQDGDEIVVRSSSPDAFPTNITTNGESGQLQDCSVDSTGGNLPASVEPAGASAEGINTALAVYHINKIERLLDQQWKCLCSENQHEEGKPFQHPNPKVNSLQQEIIGLVNILSSHYNQTGHNDGENVQPGACSELMEMTDRSAWTTKNRFDEGHTSGLNNVKENVDGDMKHKESSISPVEMATAQVDAEPETEGRKGKRQTSPDRTITPWGVGSGSTDGGIVSVEVNALEKMAKMKPQPSGEQMEGNSGSGSMPTDGDGVNAEFLTACQTLKDQMENMENPNDDMRRALVVLFQNWFSAAAEEASVASRVAAYLKEVKRTTPSLLAFLINLADDNGNTVLHYSVSHCNYSIVSLLLDTGVSDVNLQNKAGYTSVMLASLTAPDGPGGMEVVRRLMEQGDINVRSTQSGQTALHLAVRHGRVVMVRLLLSCGADANIQDGQGTTALMFASERGNTHITRLLLERSQCDLTLTDKRGRNALSIAMQSSHADTAALLQAHTKARAL